MKTEKEIRNEIETLEGDKTRILEAFRNKNIPQDVFKSMTEEKQSMIAALYWVLGENDRWD
ncbi:hypothetical protein AAGG74_15040 [Bacillus mexicanus]|uniref:hypothetical protein n=1 Tax=Bacillus mexicanus TaxID=2834415 RepID=UPI003D204F9E